MVTVENVLQALDAFAPCSTKLDFDNVGLLVGHPSAEVSRILVALDITEAVIDEAEALGAELIVSHHPLFFRSSLSAVSDESYNGKRVLKLAERKIAAICMHTNLDAAVGGVNDALAAALGIQNAAPFGDDNIGRVGMVDPVDLKDFLPFVKTALQVSGLRYNDGGHPVHKLAVIGGSGGSYLNEIMAAGCDTLLTADVKYDVFLEAAASGITVIDADHFCTENVVVPVLCQRLERNFPEVSVSVAKSHSQTTRFFI